MTVIHVQTNDYKQLNMTGLGSQKVNNNEQEFWNRMKTCSETLNM